MEMDLEAEVTDYEEEDNAFFEKIKAKRPADEDSDYEVFGFENNESEDEAEENDADSFESDIEGLGNDKFELPDKKAWGSKKKQYYRADYVDADYSTVSEKHVEEAKLEEEEALDVQQRLIKQLDEADFGLDLIPKKDDEDVQEIGEENIEADLSKLNTKQKLELLEKESPEFNLLISDFEDSFNELKNVLNPLLGHFKDENSDEKITEAKNFIKLKSSLILNYTMNIVFYLLLKSDRERLDVHPVIKQLVKYRELLSFLGENEGDYLSDIQTLLEKQKEKITSIDSVHSQLIKLKKKSAKPEKISKLPKVIKDAQNNEVNESSEEEKDEAEEMMDEDQEPNITDEKRGITYKIAKNKGLKAYRKAELRNPRVKHRNKYRKAKIRRKGAVREVRKEVKRYGGEISGINASIKKCVKLK